jgi:hypothetical protein
LISAESEWADVYAFAQANLDSHSESRLLIDEVRRRADVAARIGGDPRRQTWDQVENLARGWWRPARDYRAAVLKAARFLCLGKSRAEFVHELAARDGYQLEPPANYLGPPAPAAATASAIGADIVGEHSWRSGATANRQARLRYLSTTASRPDRQSRFRVDLDPL